MRGNVQRRFTNNPRKILIPKAEVKPLFKNSVVVDAEIITTNSAAPEIKPPIISHMEETIFPETIAQTQGEDFAYAESQSEILEEKEISQEPVVQIESSPTELTFEPITSVQNAITLDPLLNPFGLIMSEATANPNKSVLQAQMEFDHPFLKSV
jgi:hypothetical protein